MRKPTAFLLAGALLVMLLTGCGAAPDNTDENLQQIAQIEVYAGNGNLIATVTDQDTLQRFGALNGEDILSGGVSEQSELEKETGTLTKLYKIISYKEPVAAINDGSLEKLTELTVFEDSDIVREQVAQEAVKAVSVPEQFLTFYMSVSDADKDFLISLAGLEPKLKGG